MRREAVQPEGGSGSPCKSLRMQYRHPILYPIRLRNLSSASRGVDSKSKLAMVVEIAGLGSQPPPTSRQ